MESVESNFTEVDGIRFETLVPKRVLVLPKRDLIEKMSYIKRHLFTSSGHPSPGYPVQIGIRITNNSDRPLNFKFHLELFPEFFKEKNGEPIEFEGGWFHLDMPLESHFRLTMPGESTSFFLDAKICWLCGKNYGISIGLYGSVFVFEPLRPGRYHLRLIYDNQQEKGEFYDPLNKKHQVIEGLWTGKILTPFVEISLVRP